MTERHYDDEALVTMLASGAEAAEAHLATCSECSQKLDSFRCVTDALRDTATWDKREIDEEPNANTIATLRAFAETMAAEDSAAEAVLADLLAGPRETWMATLAAHPEYRTPGTVRQLIAATDKALDTMPADAAEITRLAVEIAEGLDPAAHHSSTVATLRGQAWRERAYALFYTGDIADAEAAIAASLNCFGKAGHAEYDVARSMIVKALVLQSLERYSESVEAARGSTRTFRSYSDTKRQASAQIAEVNARFRQGDFAEALQILLPLEQDLRFSIDAETHARVLANLALCSWKLRRLDDALSYHEAAAAIMETLGIQTESVRIQWAIAAMLAEEGQIDAALSRYTDVCAEFKYLGMTSVATLVGLEVAELLLMRGNYDEVVEICRVAMREFEHAGLAHTERALTALGLMREAAAERTATPMIVRHVREYLRRLPDEPDLLFLLPSP